MSFTPGPEARQLAQNRGGWRRRCCARTVELRRGRLPCPQLWLGIGMPLVTRDGVRLAYGIRIDTPGAIDTWQWWQLWPFACVARASRHGHPLVGGAGRCAATQRGIGARPAR